MNYKRSDIRSLWRWVRLKLADNCLTDEWIDHLSHYTTLVVGYSGGLDSSVLLHCLNTHPLLSGKLKAVHVNHGLSIHANHWQHQCQQVCERYAIDFLACSLNLEGMSNLEEKAREARYQVFSEWIGENDALLLAHHADDQAETLLLQLMRGAGVDGMAAMPEVKSFSKGTLLRPLLQCTREHLEAYAHRHQLIWVEDESNENRAFSRNYIRHEIMPLLKVKWPHVVHHLARSAAHCQQAKHNLEALASMDIGNRETRPGQLSLVGLNDLSSARMANVLRGWLKKNQIRCPSEKMLHRVIYEVILSKPDAKPMIQWDDIMIRRYQHTLYLLNKKNKIKAINQTWSSFPEPLSWVGDILHAKRSEEGVVIPSDCTLQVRRRQGGETFFWHGQTRPLKKLFQEWGIPPWCRDEIPLIYIGDELAVVVGHAISDRFYQKQTATDTIYSIALEPMINGSAVTILL